MSGLKPRIAVVGAGTFGRHHLRVIHQSERAELAGVLDLDPARAAAAAATHSCRKFGSLAELAGNADAAVVATPTVLHCAIGCTLMEMGIDVLVEKPIADTVDAARKLVETAARCGRILQAGHLERFNPAVIALRQALGTPLFFEIHRLSEFSPRSLDVDVVLDLMIHDIDIVLALTGQVPQEIRAAGIRILSEKVDIANVRLQFPSGCVANLTASRVSTERVRKLRLFQPHEYISLDYSRQEAVRFRVKPPLAIDFAPLPAAKDEPLRLELESFFESVATRRPPVVTGAQGLTALEVARAILDRIEEHSLLVAETLRAAETSG
ncbi:MAG TPA: Gfo/Idh/MocA family oxidoreductase [Bryobacteraceae bacterium]|nr:Gfo/Idh/MocA family oxidoreductase [Bryobacteraceae bacterium]